MPDSVPLQIYTATLYSLCRRRKLMRVLRKKTGDKHMKACRTYEGAVARQLYLNEGSQPPHAPMPSYAIALLNDGLFCDYWHYPVHAKPDELSRGRDKPRSKPLNADPLVFDTEEEAEVALDFYRQVWGDSHIDGEVRAVQAEPTHQLSDRGFEAIPMEDGLFA